MIPDFFDWVKTTQALPIKEGLSGKCEKCGKDHTEVWNLKSEKLCWSCFQKQRELNRGNQ